MDMNKLKWTDIYFSIYTPPHIDMMMMINL